MTLINCILAVLVSAVVASTAVTTPEPEHDPATRRADMTEMGFTSEERSKEYRHYDIPLSDEYQEYVQDVCDVYGIDETIVFAIGWQESRWQADVTGDHGQSFGMYQIKRKYHEERISRLGVTNLYDPYQEVWVCVDFLAELMKTYGNYRDSLTYYRYGTLKETQEPYADIVMSNADSYMER